MKYLYLRLKRFCGFVAGFVFFIAGIFKLLDPVGAGLVMKEYLDFFHLGFMSVLAKPLAVALAFLETVVGAALVTGVFRRLSAITAIAFQAFGSPLWIYGAIISLLAFIVSVILTIVLRKKGEKWFLAIEC